MNKNRRILIKITLQFILYGPINTIPALVYIMAWCRRKALIWTNDDLVQWRIYASLALNE